MRWRPHLPTGERSCVEAESHYIARQRELQCQTASPMCLFWMRRTPPAVVSETGQRRIVDQLDQDSRSRPFHTELSYNTLYIGLCLLEIHVSARGANVEGLLRRCRPVSAQPVAAMASAKPRRRRRKASARRRRGGRRRPRVCARWR